jgi:hypothetical protein
MTDAGRKNKERDFKNDGFLKPHSPKETYSQHPDGPGNRCEIARMIPLACPRGRNFSRAWQFWLF